MSESSPGESQPRKLLGVYVAMAILGIFGAIFLIELVNLSRGSGGVDEAELTEETYMDIVEPLLLEADAQHGEELVILHGCTVCHGGDNAGRLAPDYANLPEVAAERRPPLTAAAYVYESVIYPGAFIVEGYQNNMPRIYEEKIPDGELGDIIAYLLVPK